MLSATLTQKISLVCYAIVSSEFATFTNATMRGPNFKWQNFPEMMGAYCANRLLVQLSVPAKHEQAAKEFAAQAGREIAQRLVGQMGDESYSVLEAAQARITQLESELQEWADVVAAVMREHPKKSGKDDGNAPGHAHTVPGIWDADNGVLAGQPCAWCLTWNKAKKLLQESAAAKN